MKKLNRKNLVDSIIISSFVIISLCLSSFSSHAEGLRRKPTFKAKDSRENHETSMVTKEKEIKEFYYDEKGEIVLTTTSKNKEAKENFKRVELILKLRGEQYFLVKS